MLPETFRCFLVKKSGAGVIDAGIESCPTRLLPAGDVLIRVEISSLNYKDAMAATGARGIVRKFPHVPGVDAAGVVMESASPDFRPGDKVLVTGYELGADRWGGWAEFIRAPAEWVVPLPIGLTIEESMTLGTAGFTAAMSVAALERAGIRPASGEVLVTGATGGVGIIALLLLSKLGYQVVAVTGKVERHDWLKSMGAQRVIGRREVLDASAKPLLSSRWSGAIDSVGGPMLASILRSTARDGCVAACGLVGGIELSLTVMPFILRGVTLAGVDSAWFPRDRRLEIWQKLAGPWKLDRLSELATRVALSKIAGPVQRILAGGISGRVVVEPHK